MSRSLAGFSNEVVRGIWVNCTNTNSHYVVNYQYADTKIDSMSHDEVYNFDTCSPPPCFANVDKVSRTDIIFTHVSYHCSTYLTLTKLMQVPNVTLHPYTPYSSCTSSPHRTSSPNHSRASIIPLDKPFYAEYKSMFHKKCTYQ